jgi:hypothetical protein
MGGGVGQPVGGVCRVRIAEGEGGLSAAVTRELGAGARTVVWGRGDARIGRGDDEMRELVLDGGVGRTGAVGGRPGVGP